MLTGQWSDGTRNVVRGRQENGLIDCPVCTRYISGVQRNECTSKHPSRGVYTERETQLRIYIYVESLILRAPTPYQALVLFLELYGQLSLFYLDLPFSRCYSQEC